MQPCNYTELGAGIYRNVHVEMRKVMQSLRIFNKNEKRERMPEKGMHFEIIFESDVALPCGCVEFGNHNLT